MPFLVKYRMWNIALSQIFLFLANFYSLFENILSTENHIFFEVLMRNQDTQLLSPIIVHASIKPFIIKGWAIFNDKNERTKIKIMNNLSLNENNINANIFRLSEKDRLTGNVWQGPFKKPQIIRKPKGRN